MKSRIIVLVIILSLSCILLLGQSDAPIPPIIRYEYDYETLSITVKEDELAFSVGTDFFLQGNFPRAIEEFTVAIAANPRFADAYYNRGIAYYNTGETDKAIEDFARAIRLNSRFSEAYINRGIIYFEQGDNDRAIRDFNQSIRLDSKEPRSFYYRGLVYKRRRSIDQGIRDFSSAIALDAAYIEAYYNRGLLYNEKGDLDSAIADYTSAIQLDRNCFEAYHSRGIAYRKKGDIQQAIADYTQAIRLNSDDPDVYYNRGIAYYSLGLPILAVQDFTLYLARNPQDGEAYSNRALAYQATGDYARALLDFNTGIALLPNNGNYYAARGNLFYDMGLFDNALEDYSQVIAMNPRDDKAYSNRGNVYAQAGDFAKALEDYAQAVRINARNPAPHFGRGNIFDDQGEYDRAIEEYTRAIRLNPEESQFYNNRGIAFYHKKDYYQAIEDYTQALLLNPYSASTYSNRGNVYDELGALDMAIEDYSQALAINPLDYRAYNNRGVLYYNKGEFDSAIEDYTQALLLNPYSASTYSNRGNSYGEMGELEKAIDDYTVALRIRPDFELVYTNRGSIYYKQGEYDRALADFEQSLASADLSVNFNDTLDVAWSLASSIYQAIPYLASDVATQSFYDRYITLSRLGISRGIQRTEQVRHSLGSRGSEVMARRLYLYYAGVDLESHFGDPGKAFEYSESLRSRGFLEQLGTESALRLPGVSQTERDAIHALTAQIELQQGILNRYDGRRIEAEGAAEFSEAASALGEAEQQLALLDAALESRVPRYQDLRNPKPVDIGAAMAWCGDDRVALEYVLWDESIEYSLREDPPTINSYCLVISKNGVVPVMLDHSYTYLEALNSLRDSIIGYLPESEFEKERNELYATLIKPVLAHIPANIRRVVIVPDGALMYLPFDILRESAGAPDFGETYQLSLSPSISVSILAAAKPGTQALTYEPILAFGGAWYDPHRSVSERTGAGAAPQNRATSRVSRNISIQNNSLPSSRPQVWPDLPGTIDEVLGLRQFSYNRSPPVIYLGQDATEAKVKELSAEGTLRYFPILHFACHGYFDEQIPALSSIVFSEASGLLGSTGEDGYLTMPEIVLLNMNARMAILSACETGLGQIRRGDGMVGLVRSFLVAGAENLGVSLWSIDDRATQDFMSKLYRRVILDGANFKEAYFLVRNEFRRDPAWSHPIYWAAFTVYE